MKISRLFCLLFSLLLSMPAAWAEMAPCISWRHPLQPPRYVLLCIHGLGLYSKSYTDFAQRMIKNGALVYALDVRGFGSWMKAEGDDRRIDFDGCLQDVRETLESLRQANPGLPVFLLGESMGGAIVLRAASQYPQLIDGVISSVPAAERFKTKKTDLKVAAGILRGPNRDLDIGTQIVEQASTATTHEDGKKVEVVNEQLQQSWADDPLDRMKISPKELVQFQKFMKDNHDAVKKITALPVLFVQGLDDSLVKPEGTFELAQEIATPDRSMVALPTRHLVFEESQTADPRMSRASTQLVAAWINSHIGKTGADDTAQQAQIAPTAPQPAITQGRPTVLAFYTPWAEQCQSVDQIMNQCRTKYGARVNCLTVDVNDKSKQDLIKTFNVGTVPTMVFLAADGNISSTLVGATAFPTVAKSVIAILGPPPGMGLPPMQQMMQGAPQQGMGPRRLQRRPPFRRNQ